MLKNRMLIVLVTAALLVMAAVLMYQTFAIAKAIPPAQSQGSDGGMAAPASNCPFTPQEIRDIRAVYVNEIGAWLPLTEDIPTGVNGGVLELRHCSPVK